MKKIFKIAAIIAVFVMIVTGCKKDENLQNINIIQNEESLKLQNEITKFQIGETHNEILDYYYKNKKEDIYDVVKNYMIDEKGLDRVEVIQTIEKIKNNNQLIVFSNKSKGVDMSLYLDTLKNKFNLSERLIIEIHKIWNLSANNPEIIKNIVINEIKNKSWEGNDKLVASVFVDVFLNSYDFWTKRYSNSKLKPGSDVIIGDAIGALHGLIFCGIGSIIEGAVVSLIINEHWYDDKNQNL